MASRATHERRLRRAFAGPESRVFHALQKTATTLLEDLASVLSDHGLSVALHDALRVLFEAGVDGVRCGEMAGRMMARAPDVTRLLDRLEGQGLVERRRAEADRRAVVARLTAMGTDVLASVAEPVARLQREQLGHLSVQTLGRLESLLERARDGGIAG